MSWVSCQFKFKSLRWLRVSYRDGLPWHAKQKLFGYIASLASSNFNLKFASNLLLVFDTAMSQDIPSRPRLYLIQRASQVIASQPCPSPLVTQPIKISELSFIAHWHRQRPASCIWYSNGPRHHFYLIQWAWFTYFMSYSPLTTPYFRFPSTLLSPTYIAATRCLYSIQQQLSIQCASILLVFDTANLTPSHCCLYLTQ